MQNIDTASIIINPISGGAVNIIRAEARGDFILVCEHASKYIPPELNDLGLDSDLLSSHIAWDAGALGVAKNLSHMMDVSLIASNVSRLVYDANRAPEMDGAISLKSETHEVPGNMGLSLAARQARIDHVYTPFRDALGALIGRYLTAGRKPVLVTIHSFVPEFHGEKREVEVGILHDKDTRLADAMLSQETKGDVNFVTRRNEPYGPEDGVTHTLKEHALPNGLMNVMLEIRNDLIETEQQQHVMASWICELLGRGYNNVTS